MSSEDDVECVATLVSLLEQTLPDSSLADVLALAAAHACALLCAQDASLHLLDPKSNRLWTITSDGSFEWASLSSKPIGQVATTGVVSHASTTVDDELCAPVVGEQGEVLGVVLVRRRQRQSEASSSKAPMNAASLSGFSSGDESLLILLCSAIAVLLRSRATWLKYEATIEDWRKLVDALGNHAEGRQAQLELLMTSVRDILGSERGAIFLADFDAGEMLSTVALDSPPIRAPMDRSIAGRVATTGKLANHVVPLSNDGRVFRIADHETVDRSRGLQAMEPFVTRSVLCAPILNRVGDVLGVVEVLNKRKGVFDKEDERLLVGFASLFSMQLQGAVELSTDGELVAPVKQAHTAWLKRSKSAVISLSDWTSISMWKSRAAQSSSASLLAPSPRTVSAPGLEPTPCVSPRQHARR